MKFKRESALYQQVADELRRGLVRTTPDGVCLPSDGDLARRWQVSMRTVREALLVLEAEGRVQRQRGRGTMVCKPPARPVALFSELNLLHPACPRFFGIVLDIMKQRLAEHGHSTRLYMGKSRPGDEPGAFSCPELIDDAEAGQLGGIMGISSKLDMPELQRLRKAGLPMVPAAGESPLPKAFSAEHIPGMAVSYMAAVGRRRIGMIGWDPPTFHGSGGLTSAFAKTLAEHGLKHLNAWCRTELSFACPGAGWEEFREIWFGSDDKPDALLVADENFLPEVVMAVLQLGLRVPEDLLIVSHQTRHVQWQLPVAVARIEEDAELFSELLVAQCLAALNGTPAPPVPPDAVAFRLVPIQSHAAVPSPSYLEQK